MVDLGLADEERKAAGGSDQTSGGGQDSVEAFDGAEGNDIGSSREVLGAAGEYIDVRQCKNADDLAQEGGLLLVGFDKCEPEVRRPDLYRQARKAGAGADVDEVGSWGLRRRAMLGLDSRGRLSPRGLWGREQMAGGEQGFAEVTGDNFFRLADGGEVDAGIPAD